MGFTFEPFTAGGKKPVKQAKQKPPKLPALENAPGKVINNGKTIEWAHGNSPTELTPDEIERLKQTTGWKKVQTHKALAVKSLMATKGRNAIIRHFKGKKGYSPSTIANIHRALS